MGKGSFSIIATVAVHLSTLSTIGAGILSFLDENVFKDTSFRGITELLKRTDVLLDNTTTPIVVSAIGLISIIPMVFLRITSKRVRWRRRA
jgi:hypothetical protein